MKLAAPKLQKTEERLRLEVNPKQEFLIWPEEYEKLIGLQIASFKFLDHSVISGNYTLDNRMIWKGEFTNKLFFYLCVRGNLISMGVSADEPTSKILQPIGLLKYNGPTNFADICFHFGWTVDGAEFV